LAGIAVSSFSPTVASAGASATSNVLAGRTFGIPVSGTMAHSYVEAFSSELEAFRAFAEDFPDRVVLLVDTYDTARGVRHAIDVAGERAARGGRLAGIRLDSGDLARLAVEARSALERLLRLRLRDSGEFKQALRANALRTAQRLQWRF
jgi:putative nicotinate phosphoribosyltransferase